MSRDLEPPLDRRASAVEAVGEAFEPMPAPPLADTRHLSTVAMTIMMFRDSDDEDDDGFAAEVLTPPAGRRVSLWSTSACTLDNAPRPRAAAAAAAPAGRLAGRPAGRIWSCDVCASSNAPSAEACGVCGEAGPPVQAASRLGAALPTDATLPMDLCFEVPARLGPGQPLARVDGPHGPLHVPVPEGARPGERVRARLGPNRRYLVTVPRHAKEGDTLTVEPLEGETVQFHVPPGRKPGDRFKIDPQVLMVRVPEGAEPGAWVVFVTPHGFERRARVPRGVPPGQYFDVPLNRAEI